jgi:dipeptidyl aminopeptidase/acylaminoacyl peptidase
MNFRGSSGYGKEFQEAGFKEWGNKIQNDITDGTRWLIRQGLVDSTKIGIYGASFGGFAALAGVTFTPDLYSCGVSYSGITSIIGFLDAIPPYWKPFREMLYELVGNPETDYEMLKKYSPYYHTKQVKVPLLIAQGAQDSKVSKDETDKYVLSLKSNGVDVKYIVKENEGHFFENEENRFDFYRAMEKFFAKNLNGRLEEVKK